MRPEEEEILAADQAYDSREAERQLEAEEHMAKERLLKSITHALVVMTKDKDLAAKIGIHGILFLCFGPEEGNSIAQIHLVKSGDRFSWRPPYVDVTVDGKQKKLPVFKGQVAEEISQWAQDAYDAIKKDFGRAKYGKRYRVANGKAYDETPVEGEAKA
jgi:hypothetical protein